MIRFLFLPLFLSILLFLGECSIDTPSRKEQQMNLFNSCMETFSDEAKCKELQEKSEKKVLSVVVDPNTTPENLYIRQELIDLLDIKSKLYVLELLGEPEEKNIDGSGKEYFIYSRPIARYSLQSSPDRQIIIIFRKGHVTKVLHR